MGLLLRNVWCGVLVCHDVVARLVFGSVGYLCCYFVSISISLDASYQYELFDS